MQSPLSGGSGRDVFVFRSNHGKDVIKDFNPNRDHIDLTEIGKGGAKHFSDLEMSSSGSGVLIDTGAGEIVLRGVQPEDLTADQFIF